MPLTIECGGQCFKEFITLEEMVSRKDKSHFCETEKNGCKRKTVNVFLPVSEENGRPNYINENTNAPFPTIHIVITAISSILLTLAIGGIVLKVLRYYLLRDQNFLS